MPQTVDSVDVLSGVRHRVPSLETGDIDYGLLQDLTGFSVKLVWVLGQSALSRELGESITPHRFSVLEVIGCNPGLQQTELAAALALSRSAATLAIDFWEERGCVTRRSVPGDRRAFHVVLTDEGLLELERLRQLTRRADEALTDNLSASEIAELRRLLKRIHEQAAPVNKGS